MSALSPPGPPPSMPPPPTPTSLASSSHDSLRVSTRTLARGQPRDLPHPADPRPRPQPSRAAPQWPARPQSQVITDAAVWPVKAPRKPHPAPSPPAPAAADAPARRSTVSKPPSTRRSLSSRFSLHRAHPPQDDTPPLPARRSPSPDSTTPDDAGAPRTRAVQRHAGGAQARVSTSRTPGQGPALQKKRSFFRRIADRLTRSRTSLHSPRRSSVVDDVGAAPRRSATVPNKALAPISTDRSAAPASTLPTPTSTHTKSRRRPASIKVDVSHGSSPGLLTPSGVPLPPSPRPETAGTPTSSTQPSLRQPPSPAPSSRLPPSPTPSSRQPTSPAASTGPLPPPSPRQPSTPRVPQQTVPASPRPSLFAEAASPRHPSPSPSAVSSRAKPELYFPLPPHAPPVKRRDTRASRADEERERAAPVSAGRRLSDTAEGNEDEDEDEDEEEEERRASEIKVNRWLATPESPTTSSSLDHSLSQSHSQSSHSPSGGSRGVVSGKRFGSGFGGIDEEEGPDSVGLEMWRGAVMADDDVDNVLPEVERMALEAEERVRARGVGLGVGKEAGGGENARKGSLTKMGRQISLFGRRRGKEGDGVKAPTLRPRAATFADPVSTSTRRRSFGFLSPLPASPTSSLPPLPTSPTSTCPSDAHIPAARPRPRRQGVSPTMHTRGSILLEANDIQDPEVRRLSEMVFLT